MRSGEASQQRWRTTKKTPYRSGSALQKVGKPRRGTHLSLDLHLRFGGERHGGLFDLREAVIGHRSFVGGLIFLQTL